MTTTPIVWRATFFPNPASAGNQFSPQTIGLPNNNFLVVWEDDSDNNGPSPFIDVVGRIFDAEGTPTSAPFQVNSAIAGSDETGPKVVELPDGGFVMAYGSYLDALGGFITVERFDASGQSMSVKFITDSSSSLTDWEITADSVGNYTVAFELLMDQTIHTGPPVLSIDVHSITYDHLTNTGGAERIGVAQNSSEDDHLGAVASFADGSLVTFYDERDFYTDTFEEFPVQSIEFTIINNITGTVIRQPTEIAESPEPYGRAQDVAVLAGGQFVMVYSLDGPVDAAVLAMKIGSGNGAAASIGPQIVIDANFEFDGTISHPFGYGNAHVIGLKDGGFLVAWADSSVFAADSAVLRAARYDANGSPIGDEIIVTAHAGTRDTVLGRLSLTADGRVLIPFVNDQVEIAQVIIDTRDNVINGTDADEVLTTQLAGTSIFGLGGDDTLLGQVGGDTLDGGLGTDTLRGGPGADTYILADIHKPDPLLPQFAYDNVVEAAGGGIDTVQVQRVGSKQSYTLGPFVENGIVTGTDVFTLSGNTLNNRLTGNGASNTLDGGAGDDTLDGASGTDAMNGGDNDDLIYVDNAGDIVNEFNGGGSDRVLASVSYALPGGLGGFIEKLTTTDNGGIGAISLTGNNAVNTIFGNAGANILDGKGAADVLVGLGGDDMFYVDDPADVVIEGAGEGFADRVLASVSYTLGAAAQVEKLTTADNAGTGAIALAGNAFGNTIFGNAGVNMLNGAGGADTLIGLGGDDWFMVDNAGDVVIEAAGEGNDQVFANVDYALGATARVEVLSTTSTAGSANLNLTGNAFDNTVIGNAGSNAIKGLAGNDVLYGGGGIDAFAFNTALNAATNVDTIIDFTPAEDDIYLAGGIFSTIPAGTLAASAFVIGTAAGDTDDRIIYNGATGALFYDTDGAGGAAQIQFAALTSGVAVSNADFVVV